MLEHMDELLPWRQIRRARQDLQLVADDLVEHLLVQHHRDLVDRVDVPAGDHRLLLHVAEQRDFAPLLLRDGPVGAAEQRVGLDADLAQLLHRVLRRLGLDLARRGDVGHQRQVDVADVVAAHVEPHLPDGLEERQRLDVAHRAADLDDRNVGIARAALDVELDLVGDVRNDLHRAAEVVAVALLLDHRLVDLAGGEVVPLAHLRALEALVVAQIQVGFGPVLGHEHLAVLERRHRPGIDVDVRVQLDVGDADAAGFENRGEGRGGDALPQRGNYAAGYENILGHLPGAGDTCREKAGFVVHGWCTTREFASMAMNHGPPWYPELPPSALGLHPFSDAGSAPGEDPGAQWHQPGVSRARPYKRRHAKI